MLWQHSSRCEKGGEHERDHIPEQDPSLGERCVQRTRLDPMDPVNTAHLALQFYFLIISISKSCLAALEFAKDKKERVSEGKGGVAKERVERRENFMC